MKLLLTEIWVNNMNDQIGKYLISLLPFAFLFLVGLVLIIIGLVKRKIKPWMVLVGFITLYVGVEVSLFLSSWKPLMLSPFVLTTLIGAVYLKSFDKVQSKHAYYAIGIVGYLMLLIMSGLQVVF